MGLPSRCCAAEPGDPLRHAARVHIDVGERVVGPGRVRVEGKSAFGDRLGTAAVARQLVGEGVHGEKVGRVPIGLGQAIHEGAVALGVGRLEVEELAHLGRDEIARPGIGGEDRLRAREIGTRPRFRHLEQAALAVVERRRAGTREKRPRAFLDHGGVLREGEEKGRVDLEEAAIGMGLGRRDDGIEAGRVVRQAAGEMVDRVHRRRGVGRDREAAMVRSHDGLLDSFMARAPYRGPIGARRARPGPRRRRPECSHPPGSAGSPPSCPRPPCRRSCPCSNRDSSSPAGSRG